MLVKIESVYKRMRRLVSRSEWMIRLLGLDKDTAAQFDRSGDQGSGDQKDAHPAGLVLVQIDGLSRPQFDRALAKGELPFLQSLLSKEHYTCHNLYSGLPSSTPAVQGELFYGVKGIVPAFGFRGKEDGRYNRMYDPVSASRVQKTLESRGTPLLEGGSAYCNIYTGGAAESHFCAASWGWDDILNGVRKSNWLVVSLLNLPTLLRTVALMVIEFTFAVVDVVKGLIAGRAILPELKFILARVAVSVLMRDMVTIGASMDIVRGLPVIQLNYLGYDEQSHRRGPDSAFAHWTLKGIDRSIEKLWRIMHRYHTRHYDLWVYSDHGQETTTPYPRLTGYSLEDAVTTALNKARASDSQSGVTVNNSAVSFESPGQQRVDLLGGRTARLRSGQLSALDAAAADLASPVVVAMGPVGHIYFDGKAESDVLTTIANCLVSEHNVPAAVTTDNNGELVAHTGRGVFHLPAQESQLFGSNHPYLAEVGTDLKRLCHHKDAGDIVLLGCVNGIAPVSFPMENGAHAGAGPNETAAFALIPEDTALVYRGEKHTRPLTLHRTALRLLNRDTDATKSQAGNDKSQATAYPLSAPVAASNSDFGQVIQKRPLRVMTYNVHSCIGMDGIASPERVARVISRCQPDVVAMQELDVSKTRSNGVDQAQRIAELLDMKFHFHPAQVADNELYGDAILSRLPMKLVKAGPLPQPHKYSNSEIRGALWVELDYHGARVQLINTHLGLRNREKTVQMKELISERWLGHPDCQGPVIFCGDLNATTGAAVLQPLVGVLKNVRENTNSKADSARTFASRMPILPIDHIFTSQALKTISTSVPNSALTRVASDHLPLMATVQLVPQSDLESVPALTPSETTLTA